MSSEGDPTTSTVEVTVNSNTIDEQQQHQQTTESTAAAAGMNAPPLSQEEEAAFLSWATAHQNGYEPEDEEKQQQPTTSNPASHRSHKSSTHNSTTPSRAPSVTGTHQTNTSPSKTASEHGGSQQHSKRSSNQVISPSRTISSRQPSQRHSPHRSSTSPPAHRKGGYYGFYGFAENVPGGTFSDTTFSAPPVLPLIAKDPRWLTRQREIAHNNTLLLHRLEAIGHGQKGYYDPTHGLKSEGATQTRSKFSWNDNFTADLVKNRQELAKFSSAYRRHRKNKQIEEENLKIQKRLMNAKRKQSFDRAALAKNYALQKNYRELRSHYRYSETHGDDPQRFIHKEEDGTYSSNLYDSDEVASPNHGVKYSSRQKQRMYASLSVPNLFGGTLKSDPVEAERRMQELLKQIGSHVEEEKEEQPLEETNEDGDGANAAPPPNDEESKEETTAEPSSHPNHDANSGVDPDLNPDYFSEAGSEKPRSHPHHPQKALSPQIFGRPSSHLSPYRTSKSSSRVGSTGRSRTSPPRKAPLNPKAITQLMENVFFSTEVLESTAVKQPAAGQKLTPIKQDTPTQAADSTTADPNDPAQIAALQEIDRRARAERARRLREYQESSAQPMLASSMLAGVSKPRTMGGSQSAAQLTLPFQRSPVVQPRPRPTPTTTTKMKTATPKKLPALTHSTAASKRVSSVTSSGQDSEPTPAADTSTQPSSSTTTTPTKTKSAKKQKKQKKVKQSAASTDVAPEQESTTSNGDAVSPSPPTSEEVVVSTKPSSKSSSASKLKRASSGAKLKPLSATTKAKSPQPLHPSSTSTNDTDSTTSSSNVIVGADASPTIPDSNDASNVPSSDATLPAATITATDAAAPTDVIESDQQTGTLVVPSDPPIVASSTSSNSPRPTSASTTAPDIADVVPAAATTPPSNDLPPESSESNVVVPAQLVDG